MNAPERMFLPALREADQIAGVVRLVNRSVVVATGVPNQTS
jgi:hypothetical protein